MSAPRFPAGDQPTFIAAADVDGDANPDAVVLDVTRLRVLRNLGDGSFSAPITTQLAVSSTPSSLLVAQLDGDAYADVIYFDFTIGHRFSRGAGDGTFLPEVPLPALTGYFNPRAADFDGDGHDDLLASKAGALAVFLSNGDGTFASALEAPSLGTPSVAVIADMTGDAELDVVAPIFEGLSGITNLAVFQGNGDGTFDAQVLSGTNLAFPPAVAGDFDEDGIVDLAARSSNGIRFFKGLGGGVLEPGPEFPASVFPGLTSLEAMDLDNDGTLEVGYPEDIFTQQGYVRFIRYQEPGFVAYRGFPAGRRPSGTAIGDFDGDSSLDMLVMATDDGEVRLLASDGLGSFRSPYLLSDHAAAYLGQGDFDHDGRVDIATRSFRTAGVLMPRPGRSWESAQRIQPNDWREFPLTVEDFDLDGNLDFATNYVVSELPAILFGNGDGTLDFPQNIDPFYQVVSIASGDWDLDGRPDLATVAWVFNSIQLHVRLGQPDGTFSLTPLTLPGSPQAVSAHDADGDGLDDLLIDGSSSDWIAWGRGDGTFGPILTIGGSAFFSMAYAAVADLNDDDHPDLMLPPLYNSAALVIRYGLGGRLFGPPSYLGLPWPATAVASGDVDGDGNADILAIGPDLAHFRGLGNGTYFQPDIYPGVGGIDIELVDFYGTGVLDVVTSGVTVLHNRKLAARVRSEPACVGRPVRLEAMVTGIGPWSFQWRKDGMDLADGGHISGANEQILTIGPASGADDGDYDVVVTDLCATVTSPQVSIVVGTPPSAPVITAPTSVPSDTSGLTASVANTPGLTLTWSLTGGTITAGQGTSEVTFTSGPAGTTMSLEVVAEAAGNACEGVAVKPISVDYLDVAASDPFREFINTITRNGVTAGCGGGNYCPDLNVTRAQMAIFLLISKHGAGYTPPPATGLVFLDVPVNAFAAAFIEALAAAQVTSGCGGNNYCPDFFIRRSEMAVFLLRMLEGPTYTPPPATGTVFGDVAAGDFAAAWIEEIADRGITGGCGGGNFCPNAFVSRAQMAVFLTTTFDLE